MMKIWIDILTPKQVLFLGPLATRLEKAGHEVFITTRRYREVNQLLEMKGYDAKVVGEHGGASLFKKLRANALRTAWLAKLIKKTKPSVSVSFSSPEAARVAFGLLIPHYCVSDSPHAVSVSKLSIPLSERLFTPWVVPKGAWASYSISKNRIITYRAIDPAVWIKGMKPSDKVLEELNLHKDKPIVTVRPEETCAAYLLNRGVAEKSITEEVVQNLLRINEDLQVVVVGRYDGEFANRWRKLGKRVISIESVIDGPSLVAQSSLFIGAGGTMTAEAALLGVPTVSIYPSKPTFVEKYLMNVGLIYRSLDSKRIVSVSAKMMTDEQFLKKCRSKSQRLLKKMEDPITVIARHVAKHER